MILSEQTWAGSLGQNETSTGSSALGHELLKLGEISDISWTSLGSPAVTRFLGFVLLSNSDRLLEARASIDLLRLPYVNKGGIKSINTVRECHYVFIRRPVSAASD
jgi:hypothetical protein